MANEENRVMEILEKQCSLREERKKILQSSGSRKGKIIEAQETDREIFLLDLELNGLQRKKKSEIYCLATIKISENKKSPKEIEIIVKDEGLTSSFQTNEYIISKDSLLACAIMRTPVDGVAEYTVNGIQTIIRVLEKRIL